jgi:beta-glucosidase
VIIKFCLSLFFSSILFSISNLSAIADFSTYLPSFSNFKEERWDWKKLETPDENDVIPLTAISFPKNFIWGTGDSAFQTEGSEGPNGRLIPNTWTAWEEQIVVKDGIEQPRIPIEKRAGKACERWTYYKEDIKREKELHMNSHRFSLEWSKIEPKEGIFCYDAMKHYIDYMKTMIENGLMPLPTLWHHTLPLWLKDGLENKNFITYFLRYALFVLRSCKEAGLLEQTKLWLTFNEPIGFVLAAYVDGKYPPGKKMNFKVAGHVAKTLLDAHIAAYDAFKEIDPTLKISFAHMMNPIHPYHPFNPLDYLPAKIFDYIINDVALEYFKTGNFYWLNTIGWEDLSLSNFWNKIISFNFNIGIFSVKHNPNALGKLDFIGVNYYTHTLLKLFKISARPEEILADNYEVKAIKANYPEGFYHSLKKASMLGIPVLITENGFAATDSLREDYLKKHLYVVYKAMQDGIDIRGYYFWTLTDCFGWNSGQHSRHGIYAVDFETQERTYRPGADYLINTIREKSTGEPIQDFTIVAPAA